MKLELAGITIASSSDGMTVAMRAKTPALSLRASSREIVGKAYARNRSESWGKAISFSVTVVRQFPDYFAAEAFALSHLAQLSGGVEGVLKYESYLGKLVGFENAALKSVEFSSELGVQTTAEYSFVCGAPMPAFETAFTVGGVVLTASGSALTLTI